MKLSRLIGLLSVVSIAVVQSVSAQSQSAQQPKLLTIERESVKVGRGADHARNEAGWPIALEKAKSPDYYTALISMSGPPEAWYVIPRESHAAIAESMKRDDKDEVLSAEMSRLALRDAEFLNGLTTLQLMARPGLGLGKAPDVSKIRFYEISVFTVKLGQEANFAALLKAYASSRARVDPNSNYTIYESIAGMQESTFFAFAPLEDFGQLDALMAAHEKTLATANPAELEALKKYPDIVTRSVTNRYRVDPTQSYVSKETRAKDPAFWSPK